MIDFSIEVLSSCVLFLIILDKTGQFYLTPVLCHLMLEIVHIIKKYFKTAIFFEKLHVFISFLDNFLVNVL